MCSVPYKCYTNLVKTYVAELTSAEGCVELWPTTYAIYIYTYTSSFFINVLLSDKFQE